MKSSSLIVFACKSKACAPPPVGTGGSTPAKALGMSEQEMAVVYRKGLSRAVIVYVGAGHRNINRSLRGQTFDDLVDEMRRYVWNRGKSDDELRAEWDNDIRMIEAIDSNFRDRDRTHALSRDTMLYRGAGFDSVEQFKVGAVVTEKGFMSTSASEDTAVGFTDVAPKPKYSVIFNITAPKGTKVLPGEREEKELILNRGTSMRVTAVRRSNDGFVIVDTEIIPGD
jgi:hypothetical protein